MGQRRHKRQNQQLYDNLVKLSGQAETHSTNFDALADHPNTPLTDDILAASKDLADILTQPPLRELPKMKKFRFQLLHRWMVAHIAPCRVADIGGGKGLLAYLLNQSNWQATVIDPTPQSLPSKYKDIDQNKQIHLEASPQPPRLTAEFEEHMAQDFDLLVALHAHGCNISIIDAAARFGRSFILMPCCIINEPLYPPLGSHWLQCVIDYATRQGFRVEPFRLNFKGQNIGFYAQA